MTAVLYVLYLLLFLMCLNYVAELVWAKKIFLSIVMIVAITYSAFEFNIMVFKFKFFWKYFFLFFFRLKRETDRVVWGRQ